MGELFPTPRACGIDVIKNIMILYTYQAGAGRQEGEGVANPTSQCAPLD